MAEKEAGRLDTLSLIVLFISFFLRFHDSI